MIVQKANQTEFRGFVREFRLRSLGEKVINRKSDKLYVKSKG